VNGRRCRASSRQAGEPHDELPAHRIAPFGGGAPAVGRGIGLRRGWTALALAARPAALVDRRTGRRRADPLKAAGEGGIWNANKQRATVRPRHWNALALLARWNRGGHAQVREVAEKHLKNLSG
jgi:hypothetical protein